MKTHITEQVVRYAETDRMQVVHHSTYLIWFEIGRTGLLAEAGFPYHEMERDGMIFPVVEYACRLVGSADYGDTVRIETRIAEVKSRAVTFEYKITNRGTVVATGTSKHISSNSKRTPRRIAEPLVRALNAYVANGDQKRI